MKHFVSAWLFLILLALVFFYTVDPQYMGNIIGQGGNVTRVDISEPQGAATWAGVYGLMSGGTSHATLTSAETVYSQNLNLPPCFHTEIYATTAMAMDWNGLVPASPADIGSYMGIDAVNSKSPVKVFTGSTRFVVNGNIYMLPSVTTNSDTGSYDMGILMQGPLPIFVTHPVQSGTAFAGSPADYQLMLPVFFGTTTRYYFFVDPSDHCNQAPVLSGLGNIDGYVNTPYYAEFSASDADGDALALTMDPYYSFISLGFSYNEALARYEGSINFTPTIAGRYHTFFILSDGQQDVRQRVEFDIGYCGNLDLGGEPSCESRFEGCEECSQDCGACRDSADSAVIIQESSTCTGSEMVMGVYTRYKPGACTPSIVQGIEVCSPLSGAKVSLYRLEGLTRVLKDSLSTNLQGEVVFHPSISGDYVVVGDESVLRDATRWVLEDDIISDSSGKVEFTPGLAGEYKIVAERSGYYNTYDYITVEDCPEVQQELPEPQTPTGMVPLNVTEPLPEEPLPTHKKGVPTWVVILYNAGLVLGAISGIFLIHRKYYK